MRRQDFPRLAKEDVVLFRILFYPHLLHISILRWLPEALSGPCLGTATEALRTFRPSGPGATHAVAGMTL